MRFEEWFKRKFGKLPLSAAKYNSLREERKRLESRLKYVLLAVQEDDQLVKQWTAAFHAKQAFAGRNEK